MKKLKLICCLLMIGSLMSINSCKKDEPKPVPVASFTYYAYLSQAGQVDFTNTSTNATSYNWSFGDGSSSTETSPSHTYSQNGSYSVSMTAVGEGGSNSTSQTLTITSAATTGQCIFWVATQSFGTITVLVNGGNVGTITSYSTTGLAPDCGVSGMVTIERAPGTYNFTASGSVSGTWSGTVTIVAGFCSKMQLT